MNQNHLKSSTLTIMNKCDYDYLKSSILTGMNKCDYDYIKLSTNVIMTISNLVFSVWLWLSTELIRYYSWKKMCLVKY